MAENSSGSSKIWRITVVGIFDDLYEWTLSDDMSTVELAESLAEIEFADWGVKDRQKGKIHAFRNYFPIEATLSSGANGIQYFSVPASANYLFNFKGEFASLEEAEQAGKAAFIERFGVFHAGDPEEVRPFTIVNAFKS